MAKYYASIIGIINVKGGVGKTTISTNISHILATAGYKVLHVDLDPQGSSSELFTPYYKGTKLSKSDILKLDIFRLLSQPVNTYNYIFETSYENLYIIPNARSVHSVFENGSMATRLDLLPSPGRYNAFADNLDRVRDQFDYIIIDGQPSMDSITKISVIACDNVLTPVAADIHNLQTVTETLNIIDFCNNKYRKGEPTQFVGFFFNNVKDVKSKSYKTVRQFYAERSAEYFIDIPVRFSGSADNSSLSRKLWLDYALNHTINFINPCKDLLKILYKDLMLIDEENKTNLMNLGVKEDFFK